MRVAYVVGFLFNQYFDEVVLIEKSKPEWQKGLLNGVGGKIEPLETPTNAMAREFREETGIETTPESWTFFARLQSENSDVYFFCARSAEPLRPKTMTQEPVYVLRWKEEGYPLVHNIPALLRLAVDVMTGRDSLNPHTLSIYYGTGDADLFARASKFIERIK